MYGDTPELVVLGTIRKHGEQATLLYAPALAPGSCLISVSTLTSFKDGLLYASISEINPFLLRLLWVMVFHHNNGDPNSVTHPHCWLLFLSHANVNSLPRIP